MLEVFSEYKIKMILNWVVERFKDDYNTISRNKKFYIIWYTVNSVVNDLLGMICNLGRFYNA